MNKLKIAMLLLFLATNVLAQEIEIPQNVKLETHEDYKENEALVLQAIEWTHKTPLFQNAAKRKDLNAYLMKWMTGSPSVTIELVAGLMPLECSECLMSFMSGWTKYSLENNYSKDKVKSAVAGAEHMIEFYEKNKAALGKNGDIEKLAKQKNKGKLEKYVASKF